MVYKIQKEQYRSVKSVLDESVDNIEVKAVLDCTNPGTVYVDCVEAPRTAVVFSHGNEGYYFVGDYSNTALKLKGRLLKEYTTFT